MDECDCGYCGKCREQWEYENVTQRDDATYDKPAPDKDEPEHYYWRL